MKGDRRSEVSKEERRNQQQLGPGRVQSGLEFIAEVKAVAGGFVPHLQTLAELRVVSETGAIGGSGLALRTLEHSPTNFAIGRQGQVDRPFHHGGIADGSIHEKAVPDGFAAKQEAGPAEYRDRRDQSSVHLREPQWRESRG